MHKRVLFISSSLESASAVAAALQPLGFGFIQKGGIASSLRAMRDDDLVLLDLDKGGVAALKEIKSYNSDAVVILLAADSEVFEEAVGAGAYDCLEKPFNAFRLKAAASNALQYMTLRREMQSGTALYGSGHVGSNLKMVKVFKQVKRICNSDDHVLIIGEKGTGKNLVARAIHLGSRSKAGEFITFDASREGGVEGLIAEGGSPLAIKSGTLFLDGLNGLDRTGNGWLSGLLAGGAVLPAGPEVRVIGAVSGPEAGEELIGVFHSVLKLPPLREHPEDIVPMAEEFLADSVERFGTCTKRLTKEAAKALLKYRWPGNVKELKVTIARACILSNDEAEVDERHLAIGGIAPYCSIKQFLSDKLNRFLSDMAKLANSGLHGTVMGEVEKSLIELVLEKTDGNQLKAAAALGINRTTLRSKIRNYKISQSRRKG